jgi:uncharacterized membrane protein
MNAKMQTFFCYTISMIPFFISLGLIGILDGLWLGVIMRTTNAKLLSSWMTDSIKWTPALLVYPLLAIGITVFVLPKVSSIGTAVLFGALWGLLVYGVYDLTNAAIISGWPIKFVLMDITWGILSSAIVTLITYLIIR